MRVKTVAAIAALAGPAVCLVVLLPATAPTAAAPAAPAATPDRPVAPPLADAPAARAPGLKLTIRSAGQEDARVARMVALRVPAGSSPTPFLAPGPFTAVWEGAITTNFRDDYAFSADGRGKFTLSVNGAIVLETSGEDLSVVAGKAVQLQKGENKIVATYESPAAGDAWVRLFWTPAETKLREPIPWLAWAGKRTHDASDKSLREADRRRQGRELIATLRCLKCHSDAAAPTPTDMPELAMDAPSLKDAGSRLDQAWMARWIADPRSLRPDTAMPACLSGSDAPAQAADLAAYLATLKAGGDAKAEEPPAKETVAAGGKLFAQLGCVSCHTLPTRDDWATVKDRIPLRNVSAKWQPAALKAFLRQPDKHYQWIRMPNFGLSEEEAGKLAAYVSSAEAKADPAPKGDAKRGEALVVSTGCANCHALPTDKRRAVPKLNDIPATGWGRGCVGDAAKTQAAVPNYHLTAEERAALTAFAATDRSSLRREALPEFAERQIRLLRCLACHKRDERQEDPWSDLSEETEQLVTDGPPDENPEESRHFPPEQVRPTLTWTGEKLRPEWMAAFIGGKLTYKPRMFLRARMPAFPQRAAALAQGLALEHGYPAVSVPHPAPNAEEAEVGRQLARKTGGLSCTSCHDVGKTEAVGVFEAPGVNLMRVRERINKPYFDRWMLAPLRVEPGTKMPQFYKDGKTDITAVLGGDAHKQFAALWQFLLMGEEIKAPEE